jgi:peroxiredoxin
VRSRLPAGLKPRFYIASWGAWLLAGVACTPPGATGGAAALPVTDHPLNGAPAPPFSLAVRNGDRASVATYAGKIVLLDFWATWCEPCRASFPAYQALVSRSGDRLALLAISEDDEEQGIDRFAEETGVHFPIAWDADKSVAQSYQLSSMPTLFIVDKNGLVRFVHAGYHAGDEDKISAAVASLL